MNYAAAVSAQLSAPTMRNPPFDAVVATYDDYEHEPLVLDSQDRVLWRGQRVPTHDEAKRIALRQRRIMLAENARTGK